MKDDDDVLAAVPAIADMLERAYRDAATIERLTAIANHNQGAALYWQTRAEAALRALRLWRSYDLTPSDRSPAHARAYQSALSATQEALTLASAKGVQ